MRVFTRILMCKIWYSSSMKQELIWKIESLWEQARVSPVQNQLTFSPQENSFFASFSSLDELSLSETIVFTDDYGTYPGLAQDGVFYKKAKPFYVFDNHNKALMAFLEVKNQTRSPLNVIHIDAHPDDAIYPDEVPEITSENISEVYDKSRISDFLDCAQRGSLIKKVTRVTSEGEFSENPALPEGPFILSLDIDIFGPEGAFTSLESKIQTIAHYWNHASAITIATSPGFLEQEDALILIRTFMQNSV